MSTNRFYLFVTAKQKGNQKGKDVTQGTESQPVDPHECLNHDSCFGANILKDGEDPLLKASQNWFSLVILLFFLNQNDSEYPSWLWKIADNNSVDDTSKTYWRQKNKKRSCLKNREMKFNN